MGRTKASASLATTSTQPHDEERKEEEYDEVDIGKTYGAPFPFLSIDEGAHFITLKNRDIVGCKYIPSKLLEDINMHDSFQQLLTACGLKKFLSMQEHAYIDLIIEFYTSLDVNEKGSHILEF